MFFTSILKQPFCLIIILFYANKVGNYFKYSLIKPQKDRGQCFKNLNYTVNHVLYVLTFIAFYVQNLE